MGQRMETTGDGDNAGVRELMASGVDRTVLQKCSCTAPHRRRASVSGSGDDEIWMLGSCR